MIDFDQFNYIVFEDENGHKHKIHVDDFEGFDKAMSNENWRLVFDTMDRN